MADEAVAAGEGEDIEIASRPKGGMNGKKLVLFIVLPLLLIVGGLAGAYFAGLLDPLLGGAEEDTAAVEENVGEAIVGPTIFYDLPEMLVNLNTTARKSNYLKISISLELNAEEDIAVLEAVLPRVIDNFQVYLRELRIEDLQGSAGLQRLREELLLRVNTAARGANVKDVLFKEMLVQ